jgi:hypothetical protein
VFTAEILDAIAEIHPDGLPYGKTEALQRLWMSYGYFLAKHGTDKSADWKGLLETVSKVGYKDVNRLAQDIRMYVLNSRQPANAARWWGENKDRCLAFVNDNLPKAESAAYAV